MQWYQMSTTIKGIEASVYAASYWRGGGTDSYILTVKWLSQLIINGEHLTEDEVTLLANFIQNGKLELEVNVNEFVQKTAAEVYISGDKMLAYRYGMLDLL